MAQLETIILCMCEFSHVLNLISLSDIYFKRVTFHFHSGLAKNVNKGALSPVMLPQNVESVPEEISRVLACSCQADEPCNKGNCSCRSFHISYMMLGKCSTGNVMCASPGSVPEAYDFETLIQLYHQ